MNIYLYKIKTLEGYYYTIDDEEANVAWNLGGNVKCERIC